MATLAAATTSPNRDPGLAAALRAGTRADHARAERSGIVGELLRGRASRRGYVLYLRNLLAVYQALESALERRREAPGVDALAQPALYRQAALRSDLEHLCGSDWQATLPLLPAGRSYAERIAAAAAGDGSRLLAHAYTRYLGDLSGGQVLRALLTRTLGLNEDALAFYRFSGIVDMAAYKAELRRSLDRAGRDIADPEAVVREAGVAFRLNIALSNAVRCACA